MKTAFYLLLILGLLNPWRMYGQAPQTDSESKEAISKLGFIVGKWAGSGWMMGRDGQKHDFQQNETIQFKLDSTAILVEGLGTSAGTIIHNAMAIITYNKADNNYQFNSFLSTGRGGVFKAELTGDKFYWYPNENMRYIIYRNDKGQWYETGELKREGDWMQFFEMTLNKM